MNSVLLVIKRQGVVPALLRRAALIALLFGLLHVFGARECTSVLCGTRPEVAGSFLVAALTGVAYIIAYILFTVVMPVLLIAAGMLGVGGICRSTKSRTRLTTRTEIGGCR